MTTTVVPGFRFKDGKLHVFAEKTVMVIHGWPGLDAVRKPVGGKTWVRFIPAFRLVRPYRRNPRSKDGPQLVLPLDAAPSRPATPSLADQRKRAFDSFRFSLPKEVAACAEGFQSLQWPLLLLFQKQPHAVEVCRSNPAMVFCLANADFFGREGVSDLPAFAARIVLQRQKDILHWLGFPATESAARITAKVLPESVSVRSMRGLRALLGDGEAAKGLSHLAQVNSGVIALLADPALRVRCTPQLLAEVAEAGAEKYRAVTADRISDILLMERQLNVGSRARSFRSIDQVTRDHAEASLEFSKHRMLSSLAVRFPRPPLAGTASISPLCTPAELAAEGRDQQNCVGSYSQRVLDGETYIYRVLKPERATLSVVKGDDGNWEISQLLLSLNRPVGAKTREAVRIWLEQYAVSA